MGAPGKEEAFAPCRGRVAGWGMGKEAGGTGSVVWQGWGADAGLHEEERKGSKLLSQGSNVTVTHAKELCPVCGSRNTILVFRNTCPLAQLEETFILIFIFS